MSAINSHTILQEYDGRLLKNIDWQRQWNLLFEWTNCKNCTTQCVYIVQKTKDMRKSEDCQWLGWQETEFIIKKDPPTFMCNIPRIPPTPTSISLRLPSRNEPRVVKSFTVFQVMFWSKLKIMEATLNKLFILILNMSFMNTIFLNKPIYE